MDEGVSGLNDDFWIVGRLEGQVGVSVEEGEEKQEATKVHTDLRGSD